MRQTNIAVAQHINTKSPQKNTKRIFRKTLPLGVLLLILLSSIVSRFEYQSYAASYQSNQLLAQEGMQQLSKIRTSLNTLVHNPLDVHKIAEIQYEFAASIKIFTQISDDLKTVPGAVLLLPVYGPRLQAALHLASLSLELSQAGMAGCDIINLLISRLYSPTQNLMDGITAADLSVIAQKVRSLQITLALARTETDQLQSLDMLQNARMSELVNSVRKNIPLFQEGLHRIESVLPVLPALLGIGTPTNYFVEVLDSTELRPGGGFIGNYGTVTLSGGLLVTAHITDTDLLDHPFAASGMGIPFPPAYSWFDIARGNWGVRDSNLDADFPTDAQTAEAKYVREGGSVPLQGVLAITPTLIQHALAITGPVTIPEYHETVNAQNLIERIHYYQLGHGVQGPDDIASPDGYSSLRKRFTALMTEHFLARMRQIAPAHISQFIQLFIDAVQTKDLQLYFNNPTMETQLHTMHLDSSIQSVPGDDLFVVDANIGANKANSLITTTLTDTITIDTLGDALHHALLRYSWTTQGQIYGPPLYRDYIRIYVPRRSVLQTQDGWQPQASDNAFGHKVWAGFFTLTYGQTRTVALSWRVPHTTTYNAQGWHYQEMLQRQAGTLWSVHEQIQLPPCAHLKNVTGGIQPISAQAAELHQALTKNTDVAIDYTCAL
jgi:Protein of unknown function (DUF4012)